MMLNTMTVNDNLSQFGENITYATTELNIFTFSLIHYEIQTVDPTYYRAHRINTFPPSRRIN